MTQQETATLSSLVTLRAIPEQPHWGILVLSLMVRATTLSLPLPLATLHFGQGDFTIEGWIYPTAAAGTSRVFYDGRPINTQGLYPTLYLYATDNSLRLLHK